MYVVRRPFKNCGVALLPGTVVEPKNIKRFKSRLCDRYIIEVTDSNKADWEHYLNVKFGATIDEPVKEKPVKEKPVKVEKPKAKAIAK